MINNNMRLDEFIRPDYANMSEEELLAKLDDSLSRMSNSIDRSNKRIENESRFEDTRSVQALPQAR